jgi:hypothetical protein
VRVRARFECPFVPPEALRFLWRGVAVGNRDASADRAVHVRARVCGHAYRRLRAGIACVRVCVCVCVCVRARACPSSLLRVTAALRRSQNQIGDGGAAALASSLKGLTALETLWLW